MHAREEGLRTALVLLITTNHSATNAKLQSAPHLDAGFQGSRKKSEMQFVEDDLFTFKLVVNSLGRDRTFQEKRARRRLRGRNDPWKPVQEYQPSESMSANDRLLQKEKPSSIYQTRASFKLPKLGFCLEGTCPKNHRLYTCHNTAIGNWGPALAREESRKCLQRALWAEIWMMAKSMLFRRHQKAGTIFGWIYTQIWGEGSLFKLTP